VFYLLSIQPEDILVVEDMRSSLDSIAEIEAESEIQAREMYASIHGIDVARVQVLSWGEKSVVPMLEQATSSDAQRRSESDDKSQDAQTLVPSAKRPTEATLVALRLRLHTLRKAYQTACEACTALTSTRDLLACTDSQHLMSVQHDAWMQASDYRSKLWTLVLAANVDLRTAKYTFEHSQD
jgi:hypothetical protein